MLTLNDIGCKLQTSILLCYKGALTGAWFKKLKACINLALKLWPVEGKNLLHSFLFVLWRRPYILSCVR